MTPTMLSIHNECRIIFQEREAKHCTTKMPSSDMVAVWLVRLNPLARITIVISGAVLIHLSLGTYHTFGNYI